MLLLFLRLLMAHMIADFILQSNIVYNLKIKTIWGQILHGVIIFITSILLTLPYPKITLFWVYLLAITALHIIQDSIKIKYFKDSLFPFWPFIADQVMHILVTATVFLLPLKNLPASPYNEWMILLMIGYIFVSWQAIYFIDTFRRTFLKNHYTPGNGQDKYFVSVHEKYYGIIERLTLTTFVFMGGWFYSLILPVALLRFLSKNLKSIVASVLGLILSIATGIIIRIISFKI